jgi:hypothetical protein
MATKTKTTRRVHTLELDDPLAPDMSGGALDADDSEEGGNLEEKAADFIEELLAEFRAGSIDYAELKKKVGKVLGVFEDGDGGDGGGSPVDADEDADDDEGDDPPPKKKDTEESLQDLDDDEEDDDMPDDVLSHPRVRRIVEQLDAYRVKGRLARRRKHVRKLLTESKLPKEAITKTFLESLDSAKDDKAIKKLIEDRQSIIRGKKPVSRAPGTNGAPTMTAKDFASGILR